MKGADLVTAMVKDGEVIADDRYADFSATTYSPATSYANGYQSGQPWTCTTTGPSCLALRRAG